jgi:hypothetical protein
VVSIEFAYGHVFRFDMAAERLEVIYQNVNGVTALAVAPNGGGIYMGVSYPSKDGTGRVVRIDSDGSLTTILDGLPPRVNRMAFNSEGLAYIAVQDPIVSWDPIIYTATISGTMEQLLSYPGDPPGLGNPPTVPASLVVHPLTQHVWGSEWDELWYLGEVGIRHSIPYTITNETRAKEAPMLAITPDGTMYTLYQGPGGDIPMEQGIYRVDPTGPTNDLIADLTTVNLCCVHGIITAGNDGNIYWAGDGNRYSPDHQYSQHLLQITPAGEVSLIADNVGLDPTVIVSDPDSTDLYFTSGEGVWRVQRVEELFLPLASKDNG